MNELLAVKTPEQAVAYVQEAVAQMLLYRERCRDTTQSVTVMQRNVWSFLTQHGRVLGISEALLRTGILPEMLYKEVIQRAANALAPDVCDMPGTRC